MAKQEVLLRGNQQLQEVPLCGQSVRWLRQREVPPQRRGRGVRSPLLMPCVNHMDVKEEGPQLFAEALLVNPLLIS